MLVQVSALSRKFVFILAISISGCTDLGAVRDWSTTAMEAAQFNEIVVTYADTPERLLSYERGREEFWREQSTFREEQAKALQLQLALVADYMGTLAALSADSATDYTKDVNTLTASLEKTGQIDKETLGAAGKLAATILNAAVNLWRKQRVSELITEANPPLQILLTRELKTIVNNHFRRDLTIEATLLDLHFKGLLRRSKASDTAKAALEEWFLLRKAENRRRMMALDAYLKVLDKIAKGHQELFDNRNNLDAVQLVKNLYALVKEMRANIKVIVQA